jgi:polyhydroxyalkanoate synthesis regulator phasin
MPGALGDAVGFAWSSDEGPAIELAPLGSDTGSQVLAINAAAGMIVGYSYHHTSIGSQQATVWRYAKRDPTPEELVDQLEDSVDELVDSGALEAGNGNALTQKLANAADQHARGNDCAAENQISAFFNQVESFVRTGRLTEEAGAALIAGADALMAELDC